jgi:AraC-like DNA-binding protein
MKIPLPDPFARIISVAGDSRVGAGYFYNNHRRGDSADDAVVQQTIDGSAFFEDASGRQLTTVGTAILFTHDEDSSYGYPPEETVPYKLRYVAFKLAGLKLWFERLRAEFGSVVRMPLDGESATILGELVSGFSNRSFRDRFQETDLLHQLLVALYRDQAAATRIDDPVAYGRHYLRDHFRSAINLKAVAEHCGVSREHFIRVFGKRYGEPPGALLRRLRLEQAQRMLRSTQMTVQDVAVACGFADVGTFSRAYRQKYGITPGANRRM